MKRYALTHKNGNLVDVLKNSDLYISQEMAMKEKKGGEKVFTVRPFFGTHPELADLPHMIAFRSRQIAESIEDHRRLYESFEMARQKYVELKLTPSKAAIYTLRSLTNTETQEKLYSADEVLLERIGNRIGVKK